MEANKENGQFLLQTKQLIVYYNFRKKFKEALEKGDYNLNNTSNNNQNSRHYIQNEFCLIDQEWIEKWKKHVGYKEIVNYCQNNKIFRDLDDNDYVFIKPFIKKILKKICLIFIMKKMINSTLIQIFILLIKIAINYSLLGIMIEYSMIKLLKQDFFL